MFNENYLIFIIKDKIKKINVYSKKHQQQP